MSEEQAKKEQLLVPMGNYFAAHCAGNARVFVLHLCEPYSRLIDLTPDQMATLSTSCLISGLYQDRSFFVGLPGIMLTGSGVIELQIGDFSLQGADAPTADEAVEKLAIAMKNCASFQSISSQLAFASNLQHE